MDFFEKEMRKMFEKNENILDKKFIGKTMIGRLDEDLRIKLSFVTTGVKDHYTAIKLQIINRQEGEVDSEVIKFADVIGKQRMRNGEMIEPHMWVYSQNPEWYVPITENQREQIADAVESYAVMYQDEGITYS